MTPYRCPVCEGRGQVSGRFYFDGSGDGARDKCRACNGTGIVWAPEVLGEPKADALPQQGYQCDYAPGQWRRWHGLAQANARVE